MTASAAHASNLQPAIKGWGNSPPLFIQVKTIITVDLGYGDSSKGATVDALVRKHNANTVLRYNGASQAGHNVVTNDGVHHLFAQFGAGMLVNDGVRSILGPAMMVDPLSMVIEADALVSKGVNNPLTRSFIHEDCLLITPFHIALNRIKEAVRNESRHGSCGKGVGETRAYAIKVGDQAPTLLNISNKPTLKLLLERLQIEMTEQAINTGADPLLYKEHFELLKWPIDGLVEAYASFAKQTNIIDYTRLQRMLINDDKPVIAEGAQGVLLDQSHGFHPYNTWSDTTTQEAHNLLAVIGYRGEVETLGIMRTFATRHGPGPMPTECEKLTTMFNEPHNPFNEFQREFRVGWLDLAMLRYSLTIQPVDSLAVSHVDWVWKYGNTDAVKVGVRYTKEGKPFELTPTPTYRGSQEVDLERTSDLMVSDVKYEAFDALAILPLIKAFTGVPIAITSAGPSYQHRTFFQV